MVKYIILLLLVSLFGVFGTSSNYDHYERHECVENLDVFLDRAVIFRFRTDKIVRRLMKNQDLKCNTTFIARTSKMGIIAVIQKMNFKEDCNHYIQLQDRHICSEIIFGSINNRTTLNQRHRYISEYTGPFSVEGPRIWHGNDDRDFLPPGVSVKPLYSIKMGTFINFRSMQCDEDLDVDVIVAFTGYKGNDYRIVRVTSGTFYKHGYPASRLKHVAGDATAPLSTSSSTSDCDADNVPFGWFNCGFGVCILDRYLRDGVVNCPFGDCRDEGSCEMAEANSPFINVSRSDEGDVDVSGLQALNDTSLAERSEVVKSTKKMHPMQSKTSDEEIRTLEEVKNIREEFMKHNEILYNISSLMNSAVKMYQDGKFSENESENLDRKNQNVTRHPIWDSL